MKVNTDGVLLGAAMTILPSDRRLLDAGTGTGTIALMAAQRLSELTSGDEFHIDAIDIDDASAEEAKDNFEASPWSENLSVQCISIRDFVPAQEKYDLIFSNPPYFESSLKTPDLRRRAARHAETMSYREITAFAAARLSAAGRLAMILPAENETEAVRYAASFGLHIFRVLRVRTTPRRPVSRIILEFSRIRSAQGPATEELTIQKEGAYSEEYRSLTKNFLVI